LDIVFEQAQAQYEHRVVLQPLSLRLGESRIGVIGLNGSGKSTFARLINGLLLPASGRVLTNGYDTAKDTTRARGAVGFIFQDPANQIVLPLIRDDMALGLGRQRLSPSETEERIAAALARLGIDHLLDRRAHELSGGELQLAALAAVLVTAPDIVIMDEPTNQLDLRNRNLVARTIASLTENLIVVTHDLHLISGFQRVLLFHEGRLIEDGPAAAVIDRYIALAS